MTSRQKQQDKPMQKIMIIGPTKVKEGCDDSYVWTLDHPRYPGKSVKYMIKNREIMELQKVEPMRCGSFFIGQYVQSDGCILVASRIDPCFLLLPILKQGARKYSPLSQILTTGASNLRSLVEGCSLCLERLCDMKDLDEDGIFYRINDQKVEEWLKKKVTRVAEKLCEVEHRDSSGVSGGFTEGFSLGSTPPEVNVVGKATVNANHLNTALDMICEYLDSDSESMLRESYANCSEMKMSVVTEKRDAKRWSNDVDDMTALAYGQPKKAKSEASATLSQTTKNKALGKVPPKGMKTMASYFMKKT